MPKLSTRPAVPANSVTTAEMAAILGCNRSTLYRNYHRGIYRKGIHFGVLNPSATKPRLRWNVDAVLKLHGLVANSQTA